MTFESTPLPHGLSAPLRVLEPSPLDFGPAWVWWALGLLALVAFWRWRRRQGRRPAGAAASPPASKAEGGDFIDKLRSSFDGSGRYREGCYALAAGLRQHFGRRHKRPLTARTAREIAAIVRDDGVAALFEQLTQLQYRRREPRRGDFLAACDLAEEVVAKEVAG